MNIKRAKQEITNAVQAYLARDSFGSYQIPTMRQRPILLMGPPGIGKTQIMEQIAQELEIGLVAYTITHHTRQSALGLPYIEHHTFDNKEFTVTEYTMSEILASVYRTMEQTGKREGILFLDEINCISETLTPMMLQFLQCKTFGNQRLPEGWIIVAAGNPPEYNKSVREFDVVTLDRVKRIDVKEDYAVWKEYAVRKGLHGAIISYLDIRKDNFYRIESSADGMQFVTARGWEDLSEILLAYQSLNIAVDRELIGQYLQLPRIAKDFANYLALYEKYRKVYQVDDILNGTWDNLRTRELQAAPFDEKLSVLGLILSRLNELARHTWRIEQVTERLHESLLRVKNTLENQPAHITLTSELGAVNQEIAAKKENGSSDRETLQQLHITAQTLEHYLHTLELEKPLESFARLKELFSLTLEERTNSANTMGQALEYAFAFLDAALGNSQEMVMFATELTAGFYTSWYIENFGSEAYFKHNKDLLFDDTQAALLDEIALARKADSVPTYPLDAITQ